MPKRIPSEAVKILSEQDILAISKQACNEMDNKATIAANHHALSKRLTKIAETLPNNIHNIKVNYKVYLNTEPNAWSTANGCVRVNSGLMKLLTDNELQAVLAHEQGHIALNHAIQSFRQAPYIEVTDKANEIVIIVKQEIAQKYEIEADEYALNLLLKEKIDPRGLVNMLFKMPIHASEHPTSHPSNLYRINNILDKLDNQ
ncbi:M48 family metalloprotease [Gilliamella sp. B2776]|uniref:M48 family metalloprotease n=1 Tax=unclassified Gilliamella TaxID=2685620 RepID=UPI00226A9004|nr:MULTISPECIES: M48 family metalloprotease [unclassified Gilliamella]MCX8650532.1 M48 family metalloprotease [Gilliamella sp. B2779]MCX8653937.1 M48 family metalloprotease [Gilliamella sp. B2737]MCX8692380.1 M48 family metalloprotease [Gilliamella sp. B2776]MCX8703538.1 M48 family metalloprotease [Gilliamella sp. B2781]WDM19388.1 M48 family metalloprotease [Gilliamella sp. B3022]